MLLLTNSEFKQLAQIRPSSTSAVSAYSPAVGNQSIIHQCIICNTTGSAVDASIFYDIDGSTYDQTTAVFYAVEVSANSTTIFEQKLPLYNSNGNLAVQTSTANALTYTIVGEERTNI